jgi:two-component system cell cycle sensor histidine kinase/response regulator CckA
MQSCVVGLAFIVMGLFTTGKAAVQRDQPPLLLLADRDYPPLSYHQGAHPAGMDVDVARALGVKLGRDVRVALMDWDQAQEKVLRGEADGLLSMSISPERRGQFDFTDSTITHEFGIFVRRGDLTTPGPIALTGKRIGVTAGGLPRRLLAPAHDLVLIKNYEDGFARLAAGAIDAVAADRWVGAYTLERGGFRDIVSTGPAFATLQGAIAIRKGQPALVQDLDAAVRVLKSDGTLTRIQERWRPHEMLFVSRERVNRFVRVGVTILITLIGGGLVLWVMTTAAHTRARKALESTGTNERKQTEGQVRLLAHALQSANDCVSITDTRGLILYVNEAFLRTYEYEQHELIGQPIDMIRSANDPDIVNAIMDRTREQGWRGTVWNKAKSGRVFPVSLATSVVQDDQGRLLAVVGVARDMTREMEAEEALRRTEDQLRQAQKMEALGRLAGGIAHDFNNVLTVIVGYSELIDTELAPGSPIREDVGEIRRAASSAASLTRQLLIFSRKGVVQPQLLDLNDVVERIERMLHRIVGEDIQFIARLSHDPVRILADAGQIEQVIMNLVVNARDAMPEGGTLTVETGIVTLDDAYVRRHPEASAGAFARLSVTDTGHGMTPAVRAQIFTPFFTTKGPSAGTGLGLPTVHGIVHQSGGWIDVDTAVGRGTRFSIYFPRVVADPVATAPAGIHAATAAAVTGTILFVEDDESIRALGMRTLRQHGFTVVAARHGAEALLLAEDPGRSIDLLLTDIVMPGLSGRELAAQLLVSRPQLKVLYTSGYADDVVAMRDIPVNGPGFMQKPYSLEALISHVRGLLSGR